MALFNDSDRVVSAARKVKLVLTDCDGVMTDGRLYFTASGEEMKVFNVRDGQGFASWHAAGFQSGIISGRGAAMILEKRAAELGMSFVYTSSKDKSADLDRILESVGLGLEDVAFMGDDIGDIPALSRVGFPAAVADCAPAIEPHVIWKSKKEGGKGAVRELIDFILAAKSG